MRILQINQNYNFGSTGKIMKEINDTICAQGHEGYMLCAYANGNDQHLFVMEKLPTGIAVRKNILFQNFSGLTGYTSWIKTHKAIRWIDTVNPDIIHLHNIHGDWINIKMLFEYLNSIQKPLVWTLHDCWAFTGRCSHFENIGCNKWKSCCYNCPDKHVYPATYFFDFSKKIWHDKKNLFTVSNNTYIVTPSQWLAEYVRMSFLGKYNIRVIHNGISLLNFNRKETRSKYLPAKEKHFILGVASSWTPEKGFYDMLELNKQIDKEQYQIVLVGLNKKQLHMIPDSIIGIGRTNNVEELAEIYSNASVFVNPTYQDNYPTVNLEAIACGTPVITYRTGGSVESVTSDVGIVVDKGDVNGIKKAIEIICQNGNYSHSRCQDYAKVNFSKDSSYQAYIRLYEIIKESV